MLNIVLNAKEVGISTKWKQPVNNVLMDARIVMMRCLAMIVLMGII